MTLRFPSEPRDTTVGLGEEARPSRPAAVVGARRLPSLIIVDDDAVVRAALVLELQAQFHVVGEAATAEQAASVAGATRPQAALVDVDMPGGGPAAVRGILRESVGTAVVALSVDESPAVVCEMLDAGALSYRRKQEPLALVAETLRRSIRARGG